VPSPTTILLHTEPASPELALVDPALRARLVVREMFFAELSGVERPVAARSAGARRLLVGVGLAAALSAAAAAGVYAALLLPAGPEGVRVLARSASTPNAPVPSRVAAAHAAASPAQPASSGRTFAWAPVAGARSYVLEVVRSGDLVYTRTTSATNVRVPARWRRAGESLTLSPGRYTWYVWPVFGHGGGEHRGAAAVAATLEIAG
jgi:hypothetical protein